IPKLQLAETIAVANGRNVHARTNRLTGEAGKELILLTEPSDAGVHLYLNAPQNSRQEIKSSFFWQPNRWETKTYRWSAKIQVKARKRLEEKEMIFPAPPPEDPLTYSEKNNEHTEPDFATRDQPFWYSEWVQERA
ncbi:hypothetical protein, partial [Marinobacter sp.]|uniref:hypothetical protein n=1 Tax=Marinobacter sp. TaxID=50741 RepID=UPI0035C77E17